MPVCDFAHQYVQYIQESRYEAVGDLWADDAIFYNPAGQVIRGRAAIGEFYARFLRTITSAIRAASFVEDEGKRVCVMELETRMSRDEKGQWKTAADAPFSLSAIDRMVVNPQGKIEKMTVYLAPDNRWTLENAK